MVDDALKELDDPFLMADVEFLQHTDAEMDKEEEELDAQWRRFKDVKINMNFHARRMRMFKEDRHACISRLSAANAYNRLYPYLTIVHTPMGVAPSNGLHYCPSSALRKTLERAGPGPLKRPHTHNPAPPHAHLPPRATPTPFFTNRTGVEDGDVSWDNPDEWRSDRDNADHYDGWTNEGSV